MTEKDNSKKSKPQNITQPLFEYEADFIKLLKPKTLRDLKEWFSIIEAKGLTGKRAICDWLQNANALDYQPACKLSFLFLEDQKLHGPKIWFSGNLRSGIVEYESKEGSFKMISEMGAFDVLAVIDVPSEERWEVETNIPLSSRNSILHFIGRKTVEKQTMRAGTYEIKGNCIIIKS